MATGIVQKAGWLPVIVGLAFTWLAMTPGAALASYDFPSGVDGVLQLVRKIIIIAILAGAAYEFYQRKVAMIIAVIAVGAVLYFISDPTGSSLTDIGTAILHFIGGSGGGSSSPSPTGG